MATKPLPSKELLDQLLRYDAATGKLYWRRRDVEWFAPGPRRSAAHVCAQWNSRYAEKLAFTCTSTGYATGAVLGTMYGAHRLAWKIAHGTDPIEIDHVNGDRADNRLVNLRSVTSTENTKNKPLQRNNVSGRIGVRFDPVSGKWAAQIGGRDRRWLGAYEEFDQAVSAREAAEIVYGYHQNHGRT